MTACAHYRLPYPDLDDAFQHMMLVYFTFHGQRPRMAELMVELYRARQYKDLAEIFALGFPCDYLEQQWKKGLANRFAGAPPSGWATAPFERVIFSAASGHNEMPNHARLRSASKKIPLETVTKIWQTYAKQHDKGIENQVIQITGMIRKERSLSPSIRFADVVIHHLTLESLWEKGLITGKLTPAHELMLYYGHQLSLASLSSTVKRHVLATELDL